MASFIGGVYTGGMTSVYFPELASGFDPYDTLDDRGNVGVYPEMFGDMGPGSIVTTPPAMRVPPPVESPPIPEVDPGGWTPPVIGGWQPPVIGSWGGDEGGLDLTPGERGGLPWTPDFGGFDFTPGPGGGLPWTAPGGGFDLTPGPGTGIPGGGVLGGAFDFAAMMPMMLMMAMFKD